MATFIHSIHEGSAAVTPGERRFGQRLNSLLEDDYLVWFNVPVGNRRRYPDFVVLHPGRGLLVLEVKDWKAADIRKLDKLGWEMCFNGARKTMVNPLEQARQCMYELVDQLKEDRQLCHGSGPYEGKLAFPYGWGVVLPNITRKQWNEMLTEEEQELVLPGRRLICKDEMFETMDPLVFQERLWGMFEYAFGQQLTLPQIERIRWHVFPEIRINERRQGELFEEEQAPDIVKVLDLQQEQLARNLGGGHRVIHGVAGSGKTLILGYRCVQLADTLVRPVLVLCYNISLAARLHSFIAEKGLSEKVRVHHFHGWCGELLRTYHVEVAAGESPFYVRQVEAVIKGVENGLIPRGQYGALLIDEGHDFEPEWLKLVVGMVDPTTDSVLLLYDDAQSIYRKGSGLGFTLSSVGVKAAGRTTILRLNYRNSREILKLAYDVAKGSLDPTSADDDHIPLVEPMSAGMSGSRPAFRLAEDFAEELRYAARCVSRWLETGIPAREIAVICFRSWQGAAMSEKLAEIGVDYLWMGRRGGKKEYDPNVDRVTVIPAPSSKGLEFQAVVVIGLGGLEGKGDASDQMRLLYVAMTRAKRNLAITSSAPNELTARLQALTGKEMAS